MSVGARDRNYILKSDEGKSVRRRMLNATGAKLYAGDMVTLASNVLVEVTGTNTVGCAGVCVADILTGAYGPIYCSGMFIGTAKSGTDFNIGDLVYSYNIDSLYTGTSGTTTPVGKVVHVNPASGGTVYFELWSILLNEIGAKA